MACLRRVFGEAVVLGRSASEEGGGVVGRIACRAIEKEDAGAIAGCLGKRGAGDKICMEIANKFYPGQLAYMANLLQPTEEFTTISRS